MGHRIRIPAFSEHRHRNHAFNVSSELRFLPDRIHDLSQYLYVRNILYAPLSMKSSVVLLKCSDLRSKNRLEVVVDLVAVLESIAIDKQCRRPLQCLAVLIVITKNGFSPLDRTEV